MEGLFQWCKSNTRAGGRVIANFVTLENAARPPLLNNYFENVELIQVGISRGREHRRFNDVEGRQPDFYYHWRRELNNRFGICETQ